MYCDVYSDLFTGSCVQSSLKLSENLPASCFYEDSSVFQIHEGLEGGGGTEIHYSLKY